jgi:NAD(P)H-hydrate epimerase
VATVAEMRAADQAALATTDEAVLVRRAGHAVAVAARQMLGGAYGRRVIVVAGKGNNGADGRVAAAVLRRRGAAVTVLEVADPAWPETLPACDLVVDAAFGTGFRGEYRAPAVPEGTPVLAVDIPSGVAGDSGAAAGEPVRATRTVTMAALKPGLLQGVGPDCAGTIEVADIGIDVAPRSLALMEDADAALLPVPKRNDHKWTSAVAVVAGSPGMEGSAALAARGAARAGAGMVRLCVPGTAGHDGGATTGPWPLEAVRVPLPGIGWAPAVLETLTRCRALVIGPGLGRGPETMAAVRHVIAEAQVPVVADADALIALGDDVGRIVAGRAVVVTPHDGEYRALAGEAAGDDRIEASRRLSARLGVTVLLKGSLTAVAAPEAAPEAEAGASVADGGNPSTLLSAAGSARLATAGTGDVLSGIIGAFAARGLPLRIAAALGAHAHGRAAALAPGRGLVAGDLPDLVLAWLAAAGAA